MDDKKKFSRLFLKRFKIGMRIIKTVVAVFICCIIDYWRNVLPMQSTMAALICIQPDKENSINAAIARVLGTLLGSVTATITLMILAKLGITMPSLLFYIIVSVILIPLILITVKMGWPSSTVLTCVIFLSIALAYSGESDLFMSALNRMVDTFVGIIVALSVNAFLPNRLVPKPNEPEGETGNSSDEN